MVIFGATQRCSTIEYSGFKFKYVGAGEFGDNLFDVPAVIVNSALTCFYTPEDACCNAIHSFLVLLLLATMAIILRSPSSSVALAVPESV